MGKVGNLFAISGLLAAALPAEAQLWDKNLVVNGDAESGTGASSKTAAPIKNIPGWTTTGNFQQCLYTMGAADNRWMKNPGKQHFAGGPNGGAATAKQTIDLAAGATEIDAGRVRFYTSSWLSNGGSTIMAPAKVTATFLDGAGKTLLEYSVNAPALAEEDTNAMHWRSGSGFVLPNTRSVQLLVDLTGKATSFNSTTADDIAFRVSLQPVFGANLVVNGDAEDQTPDTEAPGWNGADLVPQKATIVSFVDPPATVLGTWIFNLRGGVGARSGAGYQTIDVTLAKDRIDGGGVSFSLAALIGGYQTSADTSSLKLEFLNAGGTAIGSGPQLGPITPSDRGNKTLFLARSAEGTVPAGTRVLQLTMAFATTSGNFGVHSYVDNIGLTLSSGGAVAIKDGGIVNAATGEAGPVAPGEMIMVYTTGINLASSARMQLDSAGRVASTLGNVRLFFDGTQAPILSVTSGQVGAVAPFDLDGKSNVQVRLEYQGVPSQTVPVIVAGTSPGIFTQDGAPSGLALVYNSDYTLNSKENPAAEDSAVTVYWTGGGQTDPNGVDGRIEFGPLSRPRAEVKFAIGGQSAAVLYSGGVPYGWSGLLMSEVKVPVGLVTSDPPVPLLAPIVLTAGSASSPDGKVGIWVRK
jgi:uncharacterized protein (TIGR03437 family)